MQIKTIQNAALWGWLNVTLPSCQKTAQQMPFPAAFTPSNINMLVLRYTTGTLLARQNRQPDMQGSGHWWLQNQPLSTHNCSHQAIPVWQLWTLKPWRCSQLQEDFRHTVLSTFWHPQLFEEITNCLQQWDLQCSHSFCHCKLHQLNPEQYWCQQHHPWSILLSFVPVCYYEHEHQ